MKQTIYTCDSCGKRDDKIYSVIVPAINTEEYVGMHCGSPFTQIELCNDCRKQLKSFIDNFLNHDLDDITIQANGGKTIKLIKETNKYSPVSSYTDDHEEGGIWVNQ